MASFEVLTEKITSRFHDKIKKACSPLFECFDLNDFWYYKITDSGYATYLASHAVWSEYFATEKFYLNFPLLRHPKYFQNGPTLLRSLEDKPFSQISYVAKKKFGVYHCLALINKIPEGIEGFGFSSNSSSELQKALLLKDLPMLRLFIKKFREENRFLFLLLEDYQVDLVKLLGSIFYEENSDTTSVEDIARRNFLKKMGLKNPLSLREFDVIKLLLQGYSASQIAPRIFLSRRTVEHHIERIKEKLSCHSKAELIQKGRELEDFGVLTS